jgi:hypothetical protein
MGERHAARVSLRRPFKAIYRPQQHTDSFGFDNRRPVVKRSRNQRAEKFFFRFSRNCALYPANPTQQRGGRVVTNARRDAMDADALRDERCRRGRRSRVVLAPQGWR